MPGTFAVFGSYNFWLDTTATYTGPIDVCFMLTGPIASNIFAALRIMHFESNVFSNRTTTSDYATQTICAQVPSLSPFVLAAFEP